MHLYFINGSKQEKKLATSDYIEDLFDVMLEFFESHQRFPHFLHTNLLVDKIEIRFESPCEYFVILKATSQHLDELQQLISLEFTH